MRIHPRPVRVAVALSLLAGLVLTSVGCPKHENFPPALDLEPVPTPFDFVITNPQGTDYDFTWDIDDPDGVVDHYRVYLVGEGFAADELLGETDVPSFLVSFQISVTGLKFAVSAVSTENVEGAVAVSTAP
jgi:hypothetical protein